MRITGKWAKAAALGVTLAATGVALVPVAQGQATTNVRVVHMSPDGPAVDVLVDNQRAIAGLTFPNATPAYAAVPSGQRNIKVTPAGQPGTAVIDVSPNLPAGADLTIAAIGRLANIEPLVLQDDNRAPAAGKAKVRVVHASPDAPAIDVAVTGGPVLFPNVAFKGSAGYSEVDAGTYNLEVRPTGTQNVALRVPNVALQSGQIVTIFAAGLAGDGSLRAVPVVYAGGAGAAAMPRTGTGGLTADNGLSGGLMAGLAAAALLAAGAGTLVATRRRVN